MSPRSFRSARGMGRRRHGFTLMEATVSLALLVVVLTIAMSLLFSMRSFAERQQFVVAPRQTARRALNYLSYYVSGAADLNRPVTATAGWNPNALIMYYNSSDLDPTTVVQASYNNLTGTETGNSVVTPGVTTAFGDLGTDILTITFPANPTNLNVSGLPTDKRAGALFFNYTLGCPTAATNLLNFRAATGAAAVGASPMMIMFDEGGRWTYFRIDNYVSSNCGATNPPDIVNVNMSTSPYFDPPGGRIQMTTAPVGVAAGLQFLSFRVFAKNLEQKIGLFDPANPSAGFTPIVENVEDFQVAYIYNDGQVFNTALQSLTAAGLARGVPSQSGPCIADSATCSVSNALQLNCPCGVPGARDVTLLSAVRISVTGRSTRMPEVSLGLQNRQNRYYSVDSEDHVFNPTPTPSTNPPPVYEYNRLTTTILLRNRTLTE